METLDRKLSPAFKVIEHISMIHATEKKLSNGIPVYSINAGSQELVKIEFLFAAGMYQQKRTLQAATVNNMLDEGTSKMTASQIADAVDYYGSFLEKEVTQDSASVILYTLNKHLKKTLPIVEQVIKDATFPEQELKTHLTNKKQKFLVNQQKVANVARKRFAELLFGEKHPYGVNVKEEDFDTISIPSLKEFYNLFYKSNNCKIIVSGKIEDDLHTLLNNYFGGEDWKSTQNATISILPAQTATEQQQLIFKKDALQSAIRIGRVLFNKKHPDFQSLQVLNTVLGGYFGSRLMSNIREDKGYTYGIGSAIVSLQNAGYFFITTEVGVDVCAKAIHEIYFEMDRLKQELITDEELQLVKNYILGTFLRSVDGPFALSERFKGIMNYNLGYDYFDRYIATIKTISASQLRDLANQYLDHNSMIELVVGKK